MLKEDYYYYYKNSQRGQTSAKVNLARTPDSDDFQNLLDHPCPLVQGCVCDKNFQGYPISFSMNISQTVENSLSRSVEESFEKSP